MSEQMRSEFEVWFAENYTAHKLSPRQTNCGILTSEYADSRVQMCWLAWEASRAALCVELPDVSGHYEHSKYMHGVRACRSAIHAAGVKTK